MTVQELHAAVGPGDRLTIRTAQGQELTGRVVMRNAYGFVLNLGGRYGKPGVATPENLVKIRKASAKTREKAVLL